MRKSFTLIELMIVIIVIGIIATIAIPLYHNAVEKAKAKVCETNLKVLATALESYAIENDQLPGSLGELRSKDLRKAWAQILKKEGKWKIKLAYFIVDLSNRGLAYATESWIRRYLGDMKTLTCPADPTPYPSGFSYGINCNIRNISYEEYKNLPDDYIIIGDCDSECFSSLSDLAKRHKSYTLFFKRNFANCINKGKEVSNTKKLSKKPSGYPVKKSKTKSYLPYPHTKKHIKTPTSHPDKKHLDDDYDNDHDNDHDDSLHHYMHSH